MIEKKLNLLILESSKVIAAGLVEIITGFERFNEILYAPTFDKPINLLLSDRVDIVLCSIVLTVENVKSLNELRSICKPFYFIALANSPQDEYSKKYPYLTFDSFINASEEPRKIGNLIIETAYRLKKGCLSFQP
jgi:DNA-binding NarL/FixJ family response regulator